jgi:hypothetical protein
LQISPEENGLLKNGLRERVQLVEAFQASIPFQKFHKITPRRFPPSRFTYNISEVACILIVPLLTDIHFICFSFYPPPAEGMSEIVTHSLRELRG